MSTNINNMHICACRPCIYSRLFAEEKELTNTPAAKTAGVLVIIAYKRKLYTGLRLKTQPFFYLNFSPYLKHIVFVAQQVFPRLVFFYLRKTAYCFGKVIVGLVVV